MAARRADSAPKPKAAKVKTKRAPAKAAKPKVKAKAKPATASTPPRASVRIRMYRHGLGDCFLLSFTRAAESGTTDTGTTAHVVIDCGVLAGSPDGPNRLKKAVADIHAETGGKLDLLVATHEHADHLSGFNQARDAWETFTVANTWLGWTEDLTSPEVRALKAGQALRLRAALAGLAGLSALSGRARSLGLERLAALSSLGEDGDRALGPEAAQALADSAANIRDLLAFDLEDGDDPAALLGPALAAAGADEGNSNGAADLSGPGRALAWLKQRAGRDLAYCHPADPPRPLPGRDDIRVFVLGPPVGPLLKVQDPAPGEAYLGPALRPDEGFALAAAKAAGRDGRDLKAVAEPFDRYYQVRAADLKAEPDSPLAAFFHKHYGFDPGDEDAYRRIDNDWLSQTESLALANINYVNNTSLALAFELSEGGPVLLFPGDAQAGSWRSWADLAWQVPSAAAPGGTRTVTGPDLLRRVAFYKVGHHGSHNATLRAGGLELMASPELVAFIPVHQATAKNHHPPWDFPWPNLLASLQARASHRVVLSDQSVAIADQLAPPDDLASPDDRARWDRYTASVLHDDGPDTLWVEYRYDY